MEREAGRGVDIRSSGAFVVPPRFLQRHKPGRSLMLAGMSMARLFEVAVLGLVSNIIMGLV